MKLCVFLFHIYVLDLCTFLYTIPTPLFNLVLLVLNMHTVVELYLHTQKST